MRTRFRLVTGFLRTAPGKVLARIPRIPLNQKEVAEGICFQYEIDDNRGLGLLAQKSSVSSALFLEWRVPRAAIKNATQELCYNRRFQVTLASILTGTRFRFYDATMGGTNTCFPTVCRQCGERDTPAHLPKHAKISQVPGKPEGKVEFLAQLAISSYVINPRISVPLRPFPSNELDLDLDEVCSEDCSESLSFDF